MPKATARAAASVHVSIWMTKTTAAAVAHVVVVMKTKEAAALVAQ